MCRNVGQITFRAEGLADWSWPGGATGQVRDSVREPRGDDVPRSGADGRACQGTPVVVTDSQMR